MVEFYAAIGQSARPTERVIDNTERLELAISTPSLSVAIPRDSHWLDTASNDDVTVLVCGKIFSVKDNHGAYSPVKRDVAQFILQKWQSGATGFLETLNGEFVVLIADEGKGELKVVTDTLASIPSFRYEDSQTTRITTNLQLFAADPSVDLQYHLEYLAEFFVFQRTFGIHTPLKSIQKLPPATIIDFDLQDGTSKEESYWRPEYKPLNRKYEYFVNEFVDRLGSVLEERTTPATQSLLISGGSDSRIITEFLSGNIEKGYHMNDHWNREADVAAEIAEKSNIEFDFLRRNEEYYYDTLLQDSEFDNYTSWFNESHTVGFDEEFGYDVLLTGFLADILFRGFYLPQRSIQLPLLDWKVELPSRKTVSLSDFSEYRLEKVSHTAVPPYYQCDSSMQEILEKNISQNGSGIIDHGIRYDSIASLLFSYYPLTNDYSRYYHGILRTNPRWSPFLDDRLVNLQLEYPLEFMVKKNIVNDALKQLGSELTAIPHSSSNLTLDRSQFSHLIGDRVTSLITKVDDFFFGKDTTHGTRGSWPDHQVLFENGLFEEYLYSDQVDSRMKNLRFIDRDVVYEQYESGAHFSEFYPLFTMIETPITKRIVEE